MKGGSLPGPGPGGSILAGSGNSALASTAAASAAGGSGWIDAPLGGSQLVSPEPGFHQ